MKKLINLQLFATDIKTAGKTTTYEGVQTLDQAHEYFDRALKEAIYEEYTLEKYCDTVSLPKNNGQTMTFRKLTKYVANINELQEGVIPDQDAPMGILEFKVGLGDYGGYTTFTDKYDIYALNNGVAARIQKNQGNAVGEAFQYRLRDVFYSSPNRWFAGVTTPSATLAATRQNLTNFKLDDLRKIKTALKRMKVKPYDGTNYLVLIAPEVEQTLYSLAKNANEFTFIEIQNYRANNLNPLPGEIGTWLNFRFIVEDSLGKIATTTISSTDHDVYGCVILGKYRGEKGTKTVKLEGYGEPKTIVKDVDAGGARENPLNQIGSVGWKMMGWGATVLYAEAVMVYECLTDADVYTEFDDTARAAYTAGTTGIYGSTSNVPNSTVTASTNKAIKQGKKGAVFTDDTNANGTVDSAE